MTRLGFVRWSVATLATACLLSATPTWAQTQTEVDKVVPSDGASSPGTDRFGADVDICGDVAVAGAMLADPSGIDSGAAYIYRQNGTTWGDERKLTASDGAADDEFGTSVAICGDTAVIGAPGDDGNSGAAYVFEYDGSAWQQVAKLIASDSASSDYFGTAVALDGDVIVVGAYGDDDDASASGSAYVFTYDGTVWNETTKLTASDGAANDWFGTAVAIDGSTIAVGSQQDDDNGLSSGSAYVFTDTGSGWPSATAAKLTASDGSAGDRFGFSVSVSGDTVAVGAYSYDAFPQFDVTGSGRAYVYHNDGSTWTEKQVTAPAPVKSDQFGYSVAIQGDTLIVGALNNDDSFDDSGSAYVFTYDGTNWNQATKLNASDPAEFDQLGVFVAIGGNNVIAGARGDDDDGAAYIYDLTPPADTTPPTLTTGTIDTNYCSAAAAEEAAIAATTVSDGPGSAPEDIVVTATTFIDTCPNPSLVLITATDEAGNSTTTALLDAYFTTIDAAAPAVSAPADATETTVTDPYAPLLPADVGDGTSATATDDCDTAPVITYEDLVVLATETQPTQIIRTWTATDACGNAASEDQAITVPLADSDEDGITDSDEVTLFGTDPALADTDADGLDDGEEVEIAASNDGCPDPLVADADMDTLLDGEESTLGTNPCNADTDGDGLTDDVDPFPTEPAVTTDVIADGIAELCELIAATDLDAFRGRRWMHRRIRQAILCWTLHKAEHALACDRPVLARRLVQTVLWRVDGEWRPRRDWVIDPTAAAAIEADAELLIFLLDIEIGQ